ncbi:beta-galactosidase [Gracilibacillus halophilus YIM-C55.5]|uniref:Beta-galactosidase n=1 Tax=Gracilibacillus halophilus YIM-C55.5 TaxID=1308866 RepID=N4WBI7_9BACI|nr:beta-galactosidase [Gracilibacillus halophilus]ENH96599.1 beta-galactosidase [Gracilibacillus halophilus YIM-C55.5]
MIHDVLNEKEITLGVCYYPEHWPKDLWESDFQRMKELGFTYVRMGEFAWTIFEPEEGIYDFTLFDEAIEVAKKYDLKVIMGTPTATPPVWVTEKYPEVLNVSQSGVQFKHGARRHYNYNSEKYQELSANIVNQMAAHFKDHPTVVGWQIDNELNCEINVFYSDADHHQFRQWVKRKYQTLDQLNDAWGTVFWNQTYTSWEQVYLTQPTVNDSHNPHQALDEKRFFSDSAIAFAKLQADVIRSHTNTQWITTNGMFKHLDNHQLTQNVLDFYAYDSYPNFNKIIPDDSKKPLQDRKWSFNLSNVRSFGGNFAIFEQQAGPGGWVNRIEQPTPKPGQLRLWTYQSIAHGADQILYFRWRTATKGSEIYWHGINDYHNQRNRRIDEIDQVSHEIKKIGSSLVGSSYQAKAAIVIDYQNEWDGEVDRWYGDFIDQSQEAWFKAFQYQHIPVDLLNIEQAKTVEDLNGYQVLIYPHAAILTKETANLFSEYVKQGGTAIFGCRTGYKDLTGQTYMMKHPGYLADLTGSTVEEYTLISPLQERPTVSLFHGDPVTTEGFNEVLSLEDSDVEMIGSFDNAYYRGKPAATKRKFGQGYAYYFGGVFSYDIAEQMLQDLHIQRSDALSLPEKVEIAIRVKENRTFYILLNFASSDQLITIHQKMVNIVKEQVLRGDYIMKAYDVLVLESQ